MAHFAREVTAEDIRAFAHEVRASGAAASTELVEFELAPLDTEPARAPAARVGEPTAPGALAFTPGPHRHYILRLEPPEDAALRAE